jgi:hypothetical protein
MLQGEEHGDAPLVGAVIRLIDQAEANLEDLGVNVLEIVSQLLVALLLIVYDTTEERNLLDASHVRHIMDIKLLELFDNMLLGKTLVAFL